METTSDEESIPPPSEARALNIIQHVRSAPFAYIKRAILSTFQRSKGPVHDVGITRPEMASDEQAEEEAEHEDDAETEAPTGAVTAAAAPAPAPTPAPASTETEKGTSTKEDATAQEEPKPRTGSGRRAFTKPALNSMVHGTSHGKAREEIRKALRPILKKNLKKTHVGRLTHGMNRTNPRKARRETSFEEAHPELKRRATLEDMLATISGKTHHYRSKKGLTRAVNKAIVETSYDKAHPELQEKKSELSKLAEAVLKGHSSGRVRDMDTQAPQPEAATTGSGKYKKRKLRK